MSTIPDSVEVAESAGLVYFSDDKPGIHREGRPGQFNYLTPKGEPVRDERTLERINKLAIPPAWTDVWICPKPSGHLQATGRDAKGRKQYRYHPQFREVCEAAKYEHMIEFARALPGIRTTLSKHMTLRGLPREKVLATVVHLLETTLIRVGNEDYARQNRSYGLTTLRNPHVEVEGSELRFNFTGKGGKTWRLRVKNRRVAKVVRACQELPGQNLFTYLDEEGVSREITSADVNAYLREISGRDITAKDFRTWAGTVMAAWALQEADDFDSPTAAKKNVVAAVQRVASRLGNTPTICRKCYIHPQVLSAYAEGALTLNIGAGTGTGENALSPEEAAVLALLENRLG